MKLDLVIVLNVVAIVAALALVDVSAARGKPRVPSLHEIATSEPATVESVSR